MGCAFWCFLKFGSSRGGGRTVDRGDTIVRNDDDDDDDDHDGNDDDDDDDDAGA